MTRTRILTIDPAAPDLAALQPAADCLRTGGLVAFPTETVYGLGANALDPAAVRGIFRAKGRPAADPLIVHISGREQLAGLVTDVPAVAQALLAAFWPGPLTLILPRHRDVPEEVTAGRATVAVRWPRHPVAQALLAAAGVPVAAPSANRFARPSPTLARHVLEDLDGLIDYVVDGGPVMIGLESTIVDVTTDPPAVLRPGGLPLEAVQRVAPGCVVRARYLAEAADLAAPGQLLKHYSPRAELRLLEGPRPAALAELRRLAASLTQAGRRVGALLVDEELQALSDLPLLGVSLGSQTDADEMGRRLFAALRELDERGADVILAHLPERAGLGLAIWDRLYRAAEGRVIQAVA